MDKGKIKLSEGYVNNPVYEKYLKLYSEVLNDELKLKEIKEFMIIFSKLKKINC